MLRQLLGKFAEGRAADHLKAQGLNLVARNVRSRFGEIDLIMRDGEVLVFVEVRSRTRSDFGSAADSVTPAKQRRIVLAAREYLARQRGLPPCRFDVVTLDGAQNNPVWIKNAFGDMG
ncbi:MAG: YraN family protein [Thiobacillaceae bacterium]